MTSGVLLAFTLLHGARGDVRLDAHDGLDPAILRGLVELDGAEHHAVVGERQARHALSRGSIHERVDARQAVE